MADADVIELELNRPTASARPKVGWIVALTADGELLVDFEGNPGEPIPARTTVALADSAVKTAVETRQGVVLLFEDDRIDLPIVMGLLTAPRSPEVVPVEVDGQRTEIEAKDEIVLRCGKASITLRRNGRVTIRGAWVETRASVVNRIRGGSVQIN